MTSMVKVKLTGTGTCALISASASQDGTRTFYSRYQNVTPWTAGRRHRRSLLRDGLSSLLNVVLAALARRHHTPVTTDTSVWWCRPWLIESIAQLSLHFSALQTAHPAAWLVFKWHICQSPPTRGFC